MRSWLGVDGLVARADRADFIASLGKDQHIGVGFTDECGSITVAPAVASVIHIPGCDSQVRWFGNNKTVRQLADTHPALDV